MFEACVEPGCVKALQAGMTMTGTIGQFGGRAQRIETRLRAARRSALATISQIVVTVTNDGHETWEEVFSRPPTLGQLAARVGQGVYVVSVATRRKSGRERLPLQFAAE